MWLWLCCAVLRVCIHGFPSLPSNLLFWIPCKGESIHNHIHIPVEPLLTLFDTCTRRHAHEHKHVLCTHTSEQTSRTESKRTTHKQLVSELIHSLFHLISIFYGRNNQIKSCIFRHQNHFSFVRSLSPALSPIIPFIVHFVSV